MTALSSVTNTSTQCSKNYKPNSSHPKYGPSSTSSTTATDRPSTSCKNQLLLSSKEYSNSTKPTLSYKSKPTQKSKRKTQEYKQTPTPPSKQKCQTHPRRMLQQLQQPLKRIYSPPERQKELAIKLKSISISRTALPATTRKPIIIIKEQNQQTTISRLPG